jgi:hypothetical protein
MSKETILNAYVQARYHKWRFAGDLNAGLWLKSENEKEGKPTAWADKAIARHAKNLERAERQMATFAQRLKVVPVEELK